MADDTVTLPFLASHIDRVTTAVASVQGDMAVMIAILQRIDGTLSGLNGLCRSD